MPTPPAFRAARVAVVLLGLVAPGAARAQFGGVLPPPPAPPLPVAIDDSAAGRLVTPRDTADLRQRLDIQAWVDSAAGALARTPAGQRPVPPPRASREGAARPPHLRGAPAP
ncbi:MAG TPA: hypothetical protein VEZ47_11385, partial [Gemmatirosa sp.]|nr:hypothetical protein [Gemmatirosa sp.]